MRRLCVSSWATDAYDDDALYNSDTGMFVGDKKSESPMPGDDEGGTEARGIESSDIELSLDGGPSP